MITSDISEKKILKTKMRTFENLLKEELYFFYHWKIHGLRMIKFVGGQQKRCQKSFKNILSRVVRGSGKSEKTGSLLLGESQPLRETL